MRKSAVLTAMAMVGLVAGPMVWAAAPARAADHAPCRCPAELVALGGTLPHAAVDVREHHALRIVALGSSSTYGTGASSEAATYPRRLEAELAELFPGLSLDVVNKGVPGEVAADMMARLDRDVLALHPDLVVWQTGTNDALRDLPVDEFARLTVEGIGRLHDAGIDVVLMEPQYSPKLVQQPHYAEYVDTLRTIGTSVHVPVVRRFAIMKAWEASGQFIDATMLQTDFLHMRDASYACLGWVVARSIADSIGHQVADAGDRLTVGALPAK